MSMDAALVIQPKIDWPKLIALTGHFTNRHILAEVDRSGTHLSNEAKLLVALSDYSGADAKDSITAIRNGFAFLPHQSFTFLAYANEPVRQEIERLNLPLSMTDSNVISVDRLFFISGNLRDWFYAIIAGCSDAVKFETRKLFGIFYTRFKDNGLSDLWSDYRKRDLPDKTFLLEAK